MTSLNKVFWVIFMFSTICRAFGMDAGPEATVGHRLVLFSENRFSFSMPEDFSRDMPAENMVEKVNIEDPDVLSDPAKGQVIRRWWDIKKPGFFGKGVGTVMMNIAVVGVPENRLQRVHAEPYDITNRMDFILAIDETLRKRFAPIDASDDDGYTFPSIASLMGDNFESEYRDYVFNGQKWTGYSVGGPHSELIVGFALPITQKAYLEATFSYSPNSGVLPKEFRQIAYEKTQVIEESFKLQYAQGNPMGKVVEQDWLSLTTDDVVSGNRELLVLPLFGSEVQKRLGLSPAQGEP